jgi:5'-methylthioadenosine phosphorylase
MAKKDLPKCDVGFIGGTGVYQMDGLEDMQTIKLRTPFGAPSLLNVGKLDGHKVAFIARHGEGHRLLPTEAPYKANIWALKKLGVKYCFAVSACGGLKEETAPGNLVIIDQFIDRTQKRDATFFGRGLIGHIQFAEPICQPFRDLIAKCIKKSLPTTTTHNPGTYVCMEGPAFSTKAESLMHKNCFGADIIGMTALTEAKLAREAEIAYGVVGLVTDYDAWHPGHDNVDAFSVLEVLKANAEMAQTLVKEVLRAIIAEPFVSPAHTALDVAVMSRDAEDKPAPVSQKIRQDLEPIFGRFVPPKAKEEVAKEKKDVQKQKKGKEKAKEKGEAPKKLRDPSDPKSKKTYTKDEFVEYYGKKAAGQKWAEALKNYQAAK